MATQAHRKVRVNRPFIYEGRRREIGDELIVPTNLAFELYTAAKAESTDNEPSAQHMAAKADAQAKVKSVKSAAAA